MLSFLVNISNLMLSITISFLLSDLWLYLPDVSCVGGWYIAMDRCSSLCEGAVVNSLEAVDIGEEVPGRVQVECGREEVNDGEKHEKDRTRTNNFEPCSVICM